MKLAFVALVLLVSSGGLAVAVACDQSSEYKITTKRKDDAVEVRTEKGRFEMSLPRAFFEGNPKSITLNWIDFYR
ncbi:MAG TPA: hypothetical protein VN688_27530 [Gemmataceae bacterium]|nr:hypothetical protein [Gemmataceae bacterium]